METKNYQHQQEKQQTFQLTYTQIVLKLTRENKKVMNQS